MRRSKILILFIAIAIGFFILLFFKSNLTKQGQEFSVSEASSSISVPEFLKKNFSDTDFSNANPSIEKVLSGGPGKDGIPALTNPTFEPIVETDIQNPVQVIVLTGKDEIKVYPYNILTWHEIVNDEIGDTPVAVTFCPLCGSAIVFDRRVDGEVLELGVSGALIESNMVMYDRNTESLWQQSTGKGLAGHYVGVELSIFPMQLLTVGEVKEKYPSAMILSTDTGHRRDYDKNPYGGYEETENQFFFPVGDFGGTYQSKEIMVVFRVAEKSVAVPLSKLSEESWVESIGGEQITLAKHGGEVEILDSNGKEVPFYYEMWFSFSVQHGKDAVVI